MQFFRFCSLFLLCSHDWIHFSERFFRLCAAHSFRYPLSEKSGAVDTHWLQCRSSQRWVNGWTDGRTEDWWKRLQLWSHYSTSERSWKSGRTGTQQRAKPCQRLLIGQTSFLLVYFAFSFVNAFAQNIRPGIERSPANACVLHSFRNFLYGKSEQLLNWLAIIFSPSFLIIIMPRKIGLATRVSWFVIPQLVSFSSTGYVSVFEPFSCRCETS